MRKHGRYLSYVVRHKWFVFVAGLNTGAPLWRLVIHDWSKFTPGEWAPYAENFYGQPRVGERVSGVADGAPFSGVVTHTRPAGNEDRARLDCRIAPDPGVNSDKPFWAWDFEVESRDDIRAAFDRAWLHHQHASPHHWQHWILREDSGATKVLPMPEHFVREMVADWMGAGRAITGKWEAAEWYQRNADKIDLAGPSRLLAEQLLGLRGVA